MLHCIKVGLICHVQSQVIIKNIALNTSIGDLVISFHSSGTALDFDSFEVGCKSVAFLQFLAADFLDFLLGGSVRCTDFCLFPFSSKLDYMLNLVSTLANGVQDHHSYHLMHHCPFQSQHLLIQLEAA